MPTILIEAYDGYGTRFYWDMQAVAQVEPAGEAVVIRGNSAFLDVFAKQMVYLASNDFCLSAGTHLHYDSSFGRHYYGPELILELMPEITKEILLDTSETLSVQLSVPAHEDALHLYWNHDARILVSKENTISISANRHGLMFMATVLLFLTDNSTNDRIYRCSKKRLIGWQGCDIIFIVEN